MGRPRNRTRTIFAKTGIVAAAAAGVAVSSVWLHAHPVSAACAAPANSYGTASFSVDVPATGSYRLWSRIMAPDTTNNAYMVEVDGGSCYTVGNSAIAAGAWTWIDYQNATATSKVAASLTAGKHTLKFIGNEPGVKVDRVLAVTDTSCMPSGTGDNCAVATDSTSPVTSVTAPSDAATVSGTVQVTATATDDKAVTKIEFYVNNVLKSTVTAAPYMYSWNTSGLANGQYTVTVKAYDAAGNIGTDTNTVRIGNGDTQAPTMPTNVKAVASAYNKVDLSWTASTDNTAVTGYTITRNGTPLATVDNVTVYSDTTTTPGTAYTYKVSARDAVGNTSPASSAAAVTTPTVADEQSPSIPANVTVSAASTTQLNVSWTVSTDNVGVTVYDVYRVSGPDTFKAATVNTNQFGDTGLNPGTAYGYYVVAHDAAGNTSMQSLTATGTTLAESTTPPADAATGIVRGKITGSHRRSLADVKVTIWSGNKRWQATTNNNGVYRFENIPTGRYRIQYKIHGYETEEDTVRLHSSKDAVVNNVRLSVKGGHQSWWDRWF